MALQIPNDVDQALQSVRAASTAFERLPPSHRGEYLKWIEEAKKPETRKRRISSMLERLVAKDAG